jgi:hypothetical protein
MGSRVILDGVCADAVGELLLWCADSLLFGIGSVELWAECFIVAGGQSTRCG